MSEFLLFPEPYHKDMVQEYPTINVEAENEHFATSDSIIAWLESCKNSSVATTSAATTTTSTTTTTTTTTTITTSNNSDTDINQKPTIKLPNAINNNNKNLGNLNELCKTLPPPSANHRLSAPGMAWSIIKKITQERGAQMELISAIPHASEIFRSNQIETQHSTNDDIIFRCKSSAAANGAATNRAFEFSNNTNDKQHNNNGTSIDSPPRLPVANNDSVVGGGAGGNSPVRMRGNNEWAPPRPQIIFNIHEETNFRKLMQRQNYLCAGCGTKIDLELARRLVLYCHYLGKYFCKCCFSHKAIHLPGYILQKWDFHKYAISHFALQLLDRIANEPLFNINDINPSLYRKVKKLRHLIDIRMQLYYLKIYISTCPQTERLDQEYASFTHQHLLADDVHLYSLNNLIEIQHGKLYEYLSDLVSRSIAHIARCDRCRAKGHYCQLCGPSSLISSMILSGGACTVSSSLSTQESCYTANRDPSQITAPHLPSSSSTRLNNSNSVGQNISQIASNWGRKSPNEPGIVTTTAGVISNGHSRTSSGNISNFISSSTTATGGGAPSSTSTSTSSSSNANPSIQPIPPSSNTNDHELIFPFEIGRVAQCRVCGCCFHLQCFIDAGQNCPKCERIQRRNAEIQDNSTDTSGLETSTTSAITTGSSWKS